MAGTITHEWNGTTLIITSDSGTTACDLKGRVGDTGPRGPQGAPGIKAKSAYDYAVEGGYTGTEAQFSKTLVELLDLYITFSTNTNSTKGHIAIVGMTWMEWVVSKYNTDGYYVNDDDIVCEAGGAPIVFNGTAVMATDAIIANAMYDYMGG